MSDGYTNSGKDSKTLIDRSQFLFESAQRLVALSKFVCAFFATSVLLFGVAHAQEFEAGKDYRIIKTIVQDADDEESTAESDTQIEVIEYFNYGCPHCYDLEPFIKDWLESIEEDVTFDRAAVPLRTAWVPLARAYWVAEELGVTDKVHDKIFEILHDNNIQADQYMHRVFEIHADVDPDDFAEIYQSEEVLDLMRDTQTKFRLLGLTGTPAIVVNNKYVVDADAARSIDRMFEIVDFLVDLIRTETEKEEESS